MQFKNENANDHDSESSKGAADVTLDKLFEKGISSKLLLKCLESMTQNIDRMKEKDDKFYNEVLS